MPFNENTDEASLLRNKDHQLLLDLESPAVHEKPSKIGSKTTLKKADVRRAVAAWLIAQDVSGIGFDVATRFKRFKSDLGAFWNTKGNNAKGKNPRRVFLPRQTAVVVCRDKRGECWPEFAQSAHLIARLKELNSERREFEKKLRETEPQLRDTSTLFEEYTHWSYEKSRNKSYHKLRSSAQKAANAVYRGSLFENICKANIADYHYLAVPIETVHQEELADGWGLLWVDNDFNVTLKSEARHQECSMQNRYHLIQNIASSNLINVLFSTGITQNNGNYRFNRPPRKRRSDSAHKAVRY